MISTLVISGHFFNCLGFVSLNGRMTVMNYKAVEIA
jgi:hypothetical protein